MYCSKCGAVVPNGAAFCSACGASTGAAAAPAPVYAGFWLRLLAHIIDHLVIGLPIAAVVILVIAFAGFGAAIGRPRLEARPEILAFLFGGVFLSILFLVILGSWLYYAMMESSSWQATVGKRAIGLAVTDLAGARVTFGRASGRYFAKFVSSLIPLGIGYIMAGFTAKKQALHDMIARCLVLRRA